MKKVLSKLTGLSIVLAMVFNLFMPMMVGAAEAKHFQFNAGGGTWRVGDQKNTTNDLDINASGNSGKLTEAQALMLFDSECLGQPGFVRIGWRDASSSSSPILKTKAELLALNSSSGGIELNPVWGRSAKVKVKFVIDNVKQSERDFFVNTNESGAYHITEAESDVWGALQPEAKYQLTDYKAIGGGVSPEKVEAFTTEYDARFGDAALPPQNLIGGKQIEVNTPDVQIRVNPDRSDLIKTEMIDGVRYILIRAENGVEVNGIDVTI